MKTRITKIVKNQEVMKNTYFKSLFDNLPNLKQILPFIVIKYCSLIIKDNSRNKENCKIYLWLINNRLQQRRKKSSYIQKLAARRKVARNIFLSSPFDC